MTTYSINAKRSLHYTLDMNKEIRASEESYTKLVALTDGARIGESTFSNKFMVSSGENKYEHFE